MNFETPKMLQTSIVLPFSYIHPLSPPSLPLNLAAMWKSYLTWSKLV